MTDREKLIELIRNTYVSIPPHVYKAAVDDTATAVIADHLLANGVTFATDNNAGGKWIPVTERKPEPGERVLATDGGFVGEFYINDAGQWKRYNVNHHELLMALDILWWMPMPEGPKEVE